MPFQIVQLDITEARTDAIVNATNHEISSAGGGVNGAIFRAAGPEFERECRVINHLPTGQAIVTGAGDLPARYVIHTVGPVWQGGNKHEGRLLAACYENALDLAESIGCRSITFPLISAGTNAIPRSTAFKIATETIQTFLKHHEIDVSLAMLRSGRADLIDEELYARIQRYIHSLESEIQEAALPYPPLQAEAPPEMPSATVAESSLEELLKVHAEAETFSSMLLRLIDEAQISDSECYHRANIDRRLFSKIRSNPKYRPKKNTVLAFAVALHLPLDGAKALLESAGFAFTFSSRTDIIVQYFIERGHYNIFEVNQALYAFDEPILGA